MLINICVELQPETELKLNFSPTGVYAIQLNNIICMDVGLKFIL